MDELFVGVKEIDYIETQIDTLCDKYNNRRGSDLKIKGGMMSPIEQFLLDKFNAEIGYCNIALFKAGIGISKELREELLRWGFNIHLELEHGRGTNVELNVASNDEIDAIFDEKMKANRPVFKDETLTFPDGTKSGKYEDDEQFLYDLARGK